MSVRARQRFQHAEHIMVFWASLYHSPSLVLAVPPEMLVSQRAPELFGGYPGRASHFNSRYLL
jgi:hypothetical protein